MTRPPTSPASTIDITRPTRASVRPQPLPDALDAPMLFGSTARCPVTAVDQLPPVGRRHARRVPGAEIVVGGMGVREQILEPDRPRGIVVGQRRRRGGTAPRAGA